MAFVLKRNTSYKWPVSIDEPVDGKYERKSFTAEFKQLPQSRITEIITAAQRLKIAIDRSEPIDGLVLDQEIASEILVGWSDIKDEDGKDLTFTESLKAELLEIPAFASAIVAAYGESVNKARTKN